MHKKILFHLASSTVLLSIHCFAMENGEEEFNFAPLHVSRTLGSRADGILVETEGKKAPELPEVDDAIKEGSNKTQEITKDSTLEAENETVQKVIKYGKPLEMEDTKAQEFPKANNALEEESDKTQEITKGSIPIEAESETVQKVIKDDKPLEMEDKKVQELPKANDALEEGSNKTQEITKDSTPIVIENKETPEIANEDNDLKERNDKTQEITNSGSLVKIEKKNYSEASQLSIATSKKDFNDNMSNSPLQLVNVLTSQSKDSLNQLQELSDFDVTGNHISIMESQNTVKVLLTQLMSLSEDPTYTQLKEGKGKEKEETAAFNLRTWVHAKLEKDIDISIDHDDFHHKFHDHYTLGESHNFSTPYNGSIRHQAPVDYNGSVLHQAQVNYNGSVHHQAPVGYNGSARHQASVDYKGSVPHQAQVNYNGSVRHQASVDYNGSVRHQASVNYEGSVRHQAQVDYNGSVRCNNKGWWGTCGATVPYNGTVQHQADVPYRGTVQHQANVPYQGTVQYQGNVPYQGTVQYEADIPYQGSVQHQADVPYRGTVQYEADIPYQGNVQYQADVPYQGTVQYQANVSYQGSVDATCEKEHHQCLCEPLSDLLIALREKDDENTWLKEDLENLRQKLKSDIPSVLTELDNVKDKITLPLVKYRDLSNNAKETMHKMEFLGILAAQVHEYHRQVEDTLRYEVENSEIIASNLKLESHKREEDLNKELSEAKKKLENLYSIQSSVVENSYKDFFKKYQELHGGLSKTYESKIQTLQESLEKYKESVTIQSHQNSILEKTMIDSKLSILLMAKKLVDKAEENSELKRKVLEFHQKFKEKSFEDLIELLRSILFDL